MIIASLKNLCWKELFKMDVDLDEMMEGANIPKDLICFMKDFGKINLNSYDKLTEASLKGLLDVVKYIYEIFKPCYKDAIIVACDRGHLHVIKYFYEVANLRINKYAMRYAVNKGHIHIVKYLYEVVKIDHDHKMYSDSFIGIRGYLEVLKHLYEENVELDYERILKYANYFNHVDMIKYFHNNTKVKCNIKECNYCVKSKNSYKVFTKYPQKY